VIATTSTSLFNDCSRNAWTPRNRRRDEVRAVAIGSEPGPFVAKQLILRGGPRYETKALIRPSPKE